ncbi:B-cell receptor-associated protein 29-like [Huso huso]|uniref:Endoplasmic reticulum transmembrane protein n=1 Tax=Huso huso TaxID=61971 RepID=A0ABR0ZTD4_HUSHU
MTLQWTVVATFLYIEIGVLLILCLPFISAQRWLKIFKFRIWGRVAPYWNKGFLTMIVVLIVLFLDAVREVRKYSGTDANKDAKLNPNMFDHLHMKLFRSQRNLYISGFSLFLWLTLRRVVTLITQLATAQGTSGALQTQAENTNAAAKKYMEENERLKSALKKGKGNEGENIVEDERNKLKEEIEKLKDELKKTFEALTKSKNEVEAVKKQSDGLAREYDRLLQEHEKIQNLAEAKNNKKDH